MRALMVWCLVLGLPLAARAQQAADSGFAPPVSRWRVGLFGFGARVGADLNGDANLVFGYSLDVADLYVEGLRLRPSAEVGLGGDSSDTYVGNLELIYRFTKDSDIAVPYVGVGLALQGHRTCSSDPQCPNLWAQFALGFELAIRPSFNWFLEYHGEDGFRRHRLFIGLATRRGS